MNEASLDDVVFFLDKILDNMNTPDEIDSIDKVKKLKLEPNDIVLIKSKAVLTAETKINIKKHLSGFYKNDTIILDRNFDLDILSRNIDKVDSIRELTVNSDEFEIRGCAPYIQGEEITGVRSMKCTIDDVRVWYIDHISGVKTDDVYIERIKVKVRHKTDNV